MKVIHLAPCTMHSYSSTLFVTYAICEVTASHSYCNLNLINPLTPKDPYSGRTAPLTSKCCILYIYSTNTGTEYFKHGTYCPFFSLQNAVCFIILTYLVSVLFTFYIQSVLKLKKNNSSTKRLSPRIHAKNCSITSVIVIPQLCDTVFTDWINQL